MKLISVILFSVILLEHLSAQPTQHVNPGDQGHHIDVGDKDNHDGDGNVDDIGDVDDADDSDGSPSHLLQGNYQRSQHYGGGGNYYSGNKYRPNKQRGNGYGGHYPKKYGSGYKH
ncbi:hypothetical protein MN116_000014 [Schistosoma mekongi]|uniref:Immunogenic miracidial antigen 8I n=1 Tax=Schistosoma mekongi TaxID=38744 RepID=A0AAE2D3J3_SCHME|nr:hypothetical protein MN116_000014 [Schistosoma mekongi]